ncbi:MAG TPA: exosortase/archaeosortase family protein [Gemmatales bacterium]|nr:exosortase/archaeosortase family protein [Gemmatales bacterium]
MTLALASLCLFAAIALFGRVEVASVGIAYPDSGREPLLWTSLPFRGNPDEAVERFRVTATLWHSAISSGLVRIRPDDCIEAVVVNRREIKSIRATPRSWRCWPHSRTLDLSVHLSPGPNSLTIEISNASGGFGIDIVPVYSQSAIVSMMLLIWLGSQALLRAVLGTSPGFRSFLRSSLGRAVYAAYLPLLGPALFAATMANQVDDTWHTDHGAPTMLAAIMAAAALLTCLDRLGDGPLIFRRSRPLAVGCVGAFIAASIMLAGQWTKPAINAIALAGAGAGFFATVPIRAFFERTATAPRCVAVALVAAFSPHAYWHFNLPLWGLLAETTGGMVRAVLWLAGISTTTYPGDRRTPDGNIADYYVYVSSPEFWIEIGSWCSGFEGVSLFLFLLSLFVLYDWLLFSKVRHLWAYFLLTIPFVLGVNVLRIAGLFIYAVWNVRAHGRNHAVWATIEAFHSSVGAWMYVVAFGIYMWIAYRRVSSI